MSPVLAVSGLSKQFDGFIAVDGVSFTVATGQMVALIGPNGAGKSTCFNMLGGQLRPNAGRVLLQGRDVTAASPQKLCRMGVGRTFQITATFASMTVLENVQMALIASHRRQFQLWRRAGEFYLAEAMALLDLVGMAGQAERLCGVLAYGDVKRVELAIALAGSPTLLLMDEPTAGMAPAERRDLMALVASIVQERRLSVLFTEHDMDVVFQHADRVMVLNRGRLVADDLPAVVRSNPEVREIYLGAEDGA